MARRSPSTRPPAHGHGASRRSTAMSATCPLLPLPTLPTPAPTRRVATLWANLYARPALKSPPFEALPFAARLAVAEERDGFAAYRARDLGLALPSGAAGRARGRVGRGGRALHRDALPLGRTVAGRPRLLGADPAGAPERRSRLPARLGHAGRARPDHGDRRGPLPRRPSSSGAAMSPSCSTTTASCTPMGYHMATIVEPLSEAVARIEASGGGPVTRRARLDEPPSGV